MGTRPQRVNATAAARQCGVGAVGVGRVCNAVQRGTLVQQAEQANVNHSNAWQQAGKRWQTTNPNRNPTVLEGSARFTEGDKGRGQCSAGGRHWEVRSVRVKFVRAQAL